MKTFADIVSRARRVEILLEDEQHLAFLNPSPVRPGHAIVIPKRVSDALFELEPAEYHAVWEFARITALCIRERLPCERVCTAVIGWQVRHAHIHLVPTNADGEFPPLPGVPMNEAELARIAARLRSGPGT